ncbi:MFS transporter [Bacillus methanolicus]|uniref:Multidrug resistance protein 2 n=1 Tax=Bacillus methanolicus (strain MGA3 / ATCC 53907) TaxID=796606 RepID=I3E8E5_BACMM|nr:tetracycline resistance MFS efflux pump [Bacillus methanolicus]AIE60038.1 Multidrug resistance protein 2 [Bacillus methanolicus MGA3]EIJ82766.1 putative multidrug resistance protein [Bacillus methanolicus MGA3]
MASLKEKRMPLIILMINMFIAMVGIGLIIPVLPMFLEKFGVGGQAMGYLVAVFAFTQFSFSPIAGELSDKYGRKIPIVVGLLVFTVSQLIFAVGTEIWMLYVSRLLGGIGAAFLVPPMMAYVADITSEKERGKGMGLLGAFMSLGFVIGPGIGGFLAEIGLRVPFYTSTVISGVATILSFFMLPETLTKDAQMQARIMNRQKESLLHQLKKSFKAPYFILLVLVFTMTFGLSNFEAIFGLYVDEKFGFTPKDISIIITIGALIGVIIQSVFVDITLTRFGEKKVMYWTFLTSAASMLVLLMTGTFWSILGVTIIFFASTSLLRPALNTLLSKMAGTEQGFVAGMNNMYMSIGNMVGPALAGILFDVNVNFPYVVGAVILFISFCMLLTWKEGKSIATQAKPAG